MTDSARPGRRRSRLVRSFRLLVILAAMATAGWWIVGRATADSRRLEIRRIGGGGGVAAGPDDTSGASVAPDSAITILTWNIAHGRGDVGPGLFRNFRGGGEPERRARLQRIAAVIREARPDVVILNEVDFQSVWSGGVNQAEILARATGFDLWVEQRNYDLQLPFAVLEFGNALLTDIPLDTAEWLDIPPRRWIEAALVGAKSASLVRLDARGGPLTVIPVHLEVRAAETRLAAAREFRRVGADRAAPVIFAGDFNSAPSGWPQTGDRAGTTGGDGARGGQELDTAVGLLVEAGWTSPRALGPPSSEEWTYPVPRADRSIDWILVEPPLEVLDSRVIPGTQGLSDHAPVLEVVRYPSPGGALR